MNLSILSDLIITKVYSATTMYTVKNTKTKRNNRPCWAIVIKYEGETIYTVKNKDYLSDINNFVILPKGCSYDWHCTKSGHFSIIEFESEPVFDDIIALHVKNSEKYLKVFKELEYKRTLKKQMYEIESIRDTYSILLMLIQSVNTKYLPAEKINKIDPALDYIAKNYNHNIKNDVLANLCNLSTVYFRKLFTKTMGTSPIAYVHELRIKKAKEMLKSDYSSITDIAQSLGYLNIYDFSRAFKKYTGISPSKF
ncbi:MAG: helix-turn-helix transcriptional regulator [Clostridia bacterium]|nr:helix-turn-helix transcriptional regulator [Clostridia bacterium]